MKKLENKSPETILSQVKNVKLKKGTLKCELKGMVDLVTASYCVYR